MTVYREQFAIVISGVIAIIIYFQVAKGAEFSRKIIIVLPFRILFATTNAFVEETITSFDVVCALDQIVSKQAVMLTSAFILGVLAAGFLGWLLAKSIIETRGLLWAWFIRFLQDVIILTALLSVQST